MGFAKNLATFIDIIDWKVPNYGIQERFQYLGKTLSYYFYQVLNTLVEMYAHYI